MAAERTDAPALPVFLASLWLGCSAFGGPIAHLGIFRRSYVERRRWIDADTFAGIVAICQLLPGPTSSQVGFLIGWHRAGWRGAMAAWLGFTLPSAMLMVAFALIAPHWHGSYAGAALHGLKLAAVAIVAQAVWSMARTLCPDLRRALIALLAAAGVLLWPVSGGQALVLVAGAIAGLLLCPGTAVAAVRGLTGINARTAAWALAAFLLVFVATLFTGAGDPHGLGEFAAVIYRSGASVFGGGHVVLPLLRDALVPAGWITDEVFLNGYGAAQALPGPLFTFAGFLGAAAAPSGAAALWASSALLAIFLPGLLLAVAGMPLWQQLTRHPRAGGALAGINAVVVGILAAALYDPVATTAIHSATDAAVALAGIGLLQWRRVAPLLVVALCVGVMMVLVRAS
ncbi:MAG: chromate efflux transporter [Steroidobacterales bacterium]